jgi:hypothetical protein
MLDVVLDAARASTGANGYAEILKAAADRLAGKPSAEASFDQQLADTRVLLATIGANVEVERAEQGGCAAPIVRWRRWWSRIRSCAASLPASSRGALASPSTTAVIAARRCRAAASRRS